MKNKNYILILILLITNILSIILLINMMKKNNELIIKEENNEQFIVNQAEEINKLRAENEALWNNYYMNITNYEGYEYYE